MTTECFVLARAVHFAACLLFFGVFAFDRFVAVAVGRQSKVISQWQARTRLLSLILLVVILVSGIAWFALVSLAMGGRLQTEILKTVWERTQFGTVWKFRLAVWLVAVVAAAVPGFFQSHAALVRILAWLELVLGALVLGSLAWAGHGQETSNWHLFADILHLLAAGFWPAGLLPFALLLYKLRRASESGQWLWAALLVRRFSAVSLLVVALLAVTGWVNTWFLVGSFSNLFQQPYGRWLLAKIILFCFAVAIGAVNLLRLKPRLSIGGEAGPAAARLQLNVWLELLLGVLIIVIVAILGILPPAIG
ncbi:MAG TPA: CopD family protein [Verrucomicrobiae bacterium]|jgi:putative copper resistance protein D|nr:CopD family protein [Verrucomicrobiae bacterium]